MVDKLVVKNAVNVCVSILLFTGYVYLFGIKSVGKYLDKEIIITEQEDPKPDTLHNIPPPGNNLSMYIKDLTYLSVILQNYSNHNFTM